MTYKIAGFLDKNNGSLSADLSSLCCSSSHPLLSAVFQARGAQSERSLLAESRSSSKAALTPVCRNTMATQNHNNPPRPIITIHSHRHPPLPPRPPPYHHTIAPPTLQLTPIANNTSAEMGKRAASKPMIGQTPPLRNMSQRSGLFTPAKEGEESVGAGTPRDGKASARGGNRSFESIGLQFAKQMSGMVAELNTTRCNFIR